MTDSKSTESTTSVDPDKKADTSIPERLADKKNDASPAETLSKQEKSSNESVKSSPDTTSASTEPLEKPSAAVAKPSTKSSTKASTKTASTAKSSTNKTSMNNSGMENSNTSSKSGKLALLLSIIALAGIGGHFFWQQQWQAQQQQKLIQTFKAELANQQQSTEQALLTAVSKQQAQAEKALVNKLTSTSSEQFAMQQQQLDFLNQQVSQLGQQQPSDWLLQEAEYLVRVATRSLWLEKDASNAINLLADADARLQQLNDPSLLPVRQQIHQDMESLKLLPKLETDQTLLSLMAVNHQIAELPIAMAYKPEPIDTKQDLTLSNNISEWRENLKKTWLILSDKFITVERRTANVTPLLSPKQQQNLRNNLALKLQVAQWAVSQQNQVIFDKSLAQVTAWVSTYFDTDDIAVQNFIKQINDIGSAQISVNLPESLGSLAALRQRIEQKSLPLAVPKQEQQSKQETEQKPLPAEKVTTNSKDSEAM